MNSIWTVIRFTFGQRMRSKAFIISTLLLVVLMSIVANLPNLIQSFSSNKPSVIGVFPDQQNVSGQLKNYFQSNPDDNIQITLLPDQGSVQKNGDYGKQQLSDKQLKGYVLTKPGSNADSFPSFVYESKDSTSPGIMSSLKNGLQHIKTEMAVQDAGLTANQQTRLFAPVTLSQLQISLSGTGHTRSASQIKLAYALVYVLLLLLYIGVLGSGNMVAMEITSEKSSRVMELLISSISPLKQMFGKIIGIGMVGLTQMLVFIIIGIINVNANKGSSAIKALHINLSDIQSSLVLYFVVFYICGYFIYATMYAAVGSIVSRTEDVGQAMMPLTLLVVAGFMIAMFGLQAPTAPFITVMSFIPIFTPLIMFLRIGMASPPAWQIAIGIVEMLLAVVGLAWVAAKIYRTGVLMYGKRPSFKELRKAMRNF